MKKFKFRYIIGIFILLSFVFIGGNDSENNNESKIRFTDEEYIKAISEDIKWSYPRKDVDGYVLAYYFLGDYGDHRIAINEDGGNIKWRVEKKDNIEVIGEYEGYEVNIHFPITIKKDKITVKEEGIYIEDREYNFHLTLGEVLKENELKKEYIEILKGIELSSSSLKGTSMSHLAYLIFRKAGSDITENKIDWSIDINRKDKNEILITATDYQTAEIYYTMYKDKDSFTLYPNEVDISYYRYEQVTLEDWVNMYELEKQVKKYQSLERQFNY